eukprot:CAMPEP_0116027288 /NCGR_PEP_ID=MMETSP0321-20121206/14527_1 /TAXON_ID=163516 /ORGANISM="Leptocylindrus danicus var. danicus, Strain B650" /LENGTH=497 /DNA_ID=CAMNT_0003500589 /DNA_START=18 /DNA_END=1508 /DNA_ORIENTATION=+
MPLKRVRPHRSKGWSTEIAAEMAAQNHSRNRKRSAGRLLVGLILMVGSAIGVMSFRVDNNSLNYNGISSIKEIETKSKTSSTPAEGVSISHDEDQPVHETNNDDAPWFILHAGPPKSGTTTIQCDMGRYSNLLRMDNVAYIGRFGKSKFCPDVKQFQNGRVEEEEGAALDPILNHVPDWNSCLENVKECKNRKIWNDFSSVLQHYRNQRMHVFMSDEGLIGRALYDDSEVLQLLSDALQGWRVKVVINYRRYYEWIASYYNTHFKYNGHLSSLYKDWPEDDGSGTGGGGLVIPTFPEFYHEHVQGGASDQSSFLQEPEEAPRRAFESIAEEVHLFSIYQGGDLFTNFVCQTLPKIDGEACNALVKEKGQSARADIENPSADNHDYDILAVAAYRAGLIDKTNKNLTRSKVRNKIQKYKESMGDDGKFPQTCLESPDLLNIFGKSLHNEEKLFPTWFSTDASRAYKSEEHQAGFDSFVAKRKFCSIDATLVLNQEREW